jgi:hypothetical protein
MFSELLTGYYYFQTNIERLMFENVGIFYDWNFFRERGKPVVQIVKN